MAVDELTAFLNRQDVHEETSQAYDAWNTKDNKDFAKGAYLVGVLMEKRTGVGANNSNLYVIEKKGGEKVSLWGSALIDSRLQNKEIGQEMAIVYNGKTKSDKTGREYHDYSFHFANYKGAGEVDTMLEDAGLIG